MLSFRPMKPARLALVLCAALVLAAVDAQARGGHHGSGGWHSGRFHSHTRVFVGGSFLFWPGPYYYAPATYYYYPPATPAAPLMTDPYWYYCEEAATYYPYVKECAGGWLPVLPDSAPHP